MDFIKKTQLHISTTKHEDRHQIGYSMSVGNSGETVQNEYYDEIIEKSEKAREEARVLYVAMTRAIRSFSWVEIAGKQNLSWQNLIETEV
jgi:ATP-dependent exoDNAse (exonuclease V) beta subunit